MAIGMVSQDDLLTKLQALPAAYGSDFGIRFNAGALVAKRIISPRWEWFTTNTQPVLTGSSQYHWMYYNSTGNGVTALSGDSGTLNSGDYELYTDQAISSYSFRCVLNLGGDLDTYYFDTFQASHNKTSYADYYNILNYINMPVFETVADGQDYAAKLRDFLNDPTNLTKLLAVGAALRKSLNPPTSDRERFGDESEEGGYGSGGDDPGTFDDTSDTIGIPTAPSVGVSNMGFVNVYKVNSGALAALGDDIFPTISPGVDIVAAVTALSNAIFNSRLIDYVIDAHIMPCNVPAASNAVAVKVGSRTCSAMGYKVSSDYVDFDCGSLNIAEYFGNYLDYLNTRSKLFLPFVGFVDVKPEFWQSGTIQLKYRFNVIDGSFMAYILSTSHRSQLSNSVIAQYGGACAVHVPITGVNYANMYASLIGNGSAAVAAAAGGNVAGLASSMMNVAAATPPIQQSNNYNATASFMSVRTPFLLIERPKTQFSAGYPAEQGLPLNVYMALSEVRGFATVENPRLNIDCSDEEMQEINNLLKSGVIF